jgi:hypothetical protein
MLKLKPSSVLILSVLVYFNPIAFHAPPISLPDTAAIKIRYSIPHPAEQQAI